ncbi:MAG: MBL fold metallo-hydrolase [Pseudomonadota bacterium]|nr:MBL fold metallo-hydrolase [Pseudomonadota bacterium]
MIPGEKNVTSALPAQVQVIVRDWLSSNHVLLKSSEGHVLIDSGYVRHVPVTLRLLESPHALADDPLALIVNTHCHSDHMGGNAAVARRYGCPIAIPAGEAELIEDWNGEALLLDYADQEAERFVVSRKLYPGETYGWADLEWQALAAPGHDMGALMFFNAEHGILVSGDALWRRGFGVLMPPEIEPRALAATRATLDLIASLPVRVVIPGHGDPFSQVDAALEVAYGRLARFEDNPASLAPYALKVLFAFALLIQRRFAIEELPAYVQRVGVFRDFNAQFLHQPATDLADWLAMELTRSGAAHREGGWLVAGMR